jgi:voltage-gated potassium channel
MQSEREAAKQALDQERDEILRRLEDWLETPMVALGFAWLALLVIELIWGLSPLLEMASAAIWVIFIIDFGVKFLLASRKLDYLKSNWLMAVALFVPAVRVFRVARVLRAARGIQTARVITSLNRGMVALGASFGRRGFGYALTLTGLVTFSGAAGMFALEKEVPNGFKSYSAALWWTAMLITSLGTDYWPQTAEGRVLCFLLALYGFAVFGYVTAALATFFIGRDAENEGAELAGARSVDALRAEIAALRAEIRGPRNGQKDPKEADTHSAD